MKENRIFKGEKKLIKNIKNRKKMKGKKLKNKMKEKKKNKIK